MDLWNYKREYLRRAERLHAASLGVRVAETFNLSTGLWLTYVDSKGKFHTLCDWQVEDLLHKDGVNILSDAVERR